MIDTYQSRRLAARRLWSGTVQQMFQTVEVGDRSIAQDLSESLAVFCQAQPNIPQHSLSLLIARSLCITGDSAAAGRILLHDRAHRPHADSWLGVLSSEYPFPELYPLFSSRALRPQRFSSAGTVWVLDFNKVRLTDADRHELILFRTVRVLTEQVSNVWKKADGCGTLGLKGLARLCRRRKDCGPLHDHICAVLERCARKNGWSRPPAVLHLDF